MSPTPRHLPDDMSEYLQVFLDETQEQLDDLVETLLVLENDPTSTGHLNEAFRLIHSIKGSAGMLGFDNITVLTHHLENRFERFRSGSAQLQRPTMNLVLRCIDFLRDCVARLCAGQPMGSSADLLADLKALEDSGSDQAAPTESPTAPAVDEASPAAEGSTADAGLHNTQVIVIFEAGLALADLKAQLIATRLSRLGDIVMTVPALTDLDDTPDLARFEVMLNCTCDDDAIRAAADVDGVADIALGSAGGRPAPTPPADITPDPEEADLLAADESVGVSMLDEAAPASPEAAPSAAEPAFMPEPEPAPTATVAPTRAAQSAPAAGGTRGKATETMRVDIERLDNLMNLAGELVVNRARFVQVAEEVGPAFKAANIVNRTRDFSDNLKRVIAQLEGRIGHSGEWATRIKELRTGLELIEDQAAAWDAGRRGFGHIAEAIDQLTRVSNSLQRSVLDTRMIPVGPLFTRFKRTVRDLSVERGKTVDLIIYGEKTELDKRMIDELGDPLMHLVRNAIDHGLEETTARRACGKPATGMVTLEASHSGNNVLIKISDDGGGIDVARVRDKIVDRNLLSAEGAAQLSDAQALEYIWHAGFSTAAEVTDISGRGVGMDVVRTRIGELSGSIEVDTEAGVGTTFTIRLPLTLAIINSLLIRIRDVIFSMPIDDVREIVSVRPGDIVTLRGCDTFEVRGEYVPLVGIDDIFWWHGVDYGYRSAPSTDDAPPAAQDVVILSSGGKVLGLRADELLGGQDIVIKSFSENFVPITGLSGASILGDGTVCLMLDVNRVIAMAIDPAREALATGGPRLGSG